MGTGAILMMLLAMAVIWGGLALAIVNLRAAAPTTASRGATSTTALHGVTSDRQALTRSTGTKSTFSRTPQSGQHQSSGTSAQAVPAANPSCSSPTSTS